MTHQNIFEDKYFKQRLDKFHLDDITNIETKRKTITNYIKSLESGRVEKTKEEAIQADFLNNFFGDVLGYEYKDPQKWNLEKEHKSRTDTTKADGALGFFAMSDSEIKSDVRAVIELKDALTDLDKPQHRLNDKRTPVEQAFSYSSKAGGKCKWVIVSNFKEIRIYHSLDQGSYEKFIVSELTQDENLKRFFYILQKEHLISELSESTIEKLYRERREIEQTITKEFYNDYKTLRLELFEHLKENNNAQNEFTLFNNTQKILDRFIFVCFCEDSGMLPSETLKKTKEVLRNTFDFEENKLWRQFKGLCHSIDKGNPPLNINRFNGGLFAKDEELDNLTVHDDVLLKLVDFSKYDFASDINVNILGHIFEQSLTDIEEIKTKIGNGKDLSPDEKTEIRKNGKRKKEGIFYTPEYITRYIVKDAVGGWLEDRKIELGFYDLPELTVKDIQSIKTERKKNKATGKFATIITYNKNVEAQLIFWEAYKDRLRRVKILDPACGSGAFLNQVFDFLYLEGQMVNNHLSDLRLGQLEIFELDKHILTNNIFGVDINPESVEITKLSLWLKTANKGKELTSLEENIKCGNSLIDDKEIAGEKAFNWFLEFPQVFPNFRNPNKENVIEEPTYNYENPHSKGFEKYGFDVIIGNPPYVVMSSFRDKEFEY
ncbi:MAG: N-6 DNA methylase [Bacteroidales bacterium]|nr:N-6 DNA methylase [Bacteroidales bacterium]